MSTERSHAASLQIARQTRERFVAATEGAIAEAALAVRERLMAMANQTGNAREMHQNRDDFIAFRDQESNWVGLARAGWRKALGHGLGGGASQNSLPQLELIGDEVVENNILSSRLSLVIQDKASFELNDLRLRIQYLENIPELSSRDVLRPDVLAKVLVDQWLAAGLTRPMWVKAQEVLQQKLVDTIVKAYHDANAFLIGEGVMPAIDLKGFVKRAHGAGSSAPMDLGAGPGGQFRGTGAGGSGGYAAHPGSATAPLARAGQAQPGGAMGGMGGFAPAAIGVGAGWGPPGGAPGMAGGDLMVGGGSPLLVARQRAQGVLTNLKRFVTARIGGGDAPGGGFGSAGFAGGAVPGGMAAPVFVQAIADAGVAYQQASSQFVVVGGDEGTALQQTAVELRRRTAELKKRAPTTADKATVEIVALMFQAILAEERIPFSARVWFARLQMPVLRVAIAEPEFFGTLQHPARMLIDRMGSCVMGFDAAAISGSALEGEIRRVVQVIEQYPETGQRVFKLVFDEFVAFLSKYLTQSDATQRVMSVAQQVEQKETMAIQYTIELRKMLNDIPVREEIREFLFKIWAEVLALAALRYGAQDEKTVTLKRAASDLVWAASAKPNRTDRTRVIQDLPTCCSACARAWRCWASRAIRRKSTSRSSAPRWPTLSCPRPRRFPPPRSRPWPSAWPISRISSATRARWKCRWTPPASSCCWAWTPPRSRWCPTPAPRSPRTCWPGRTTCRWATGSCSTTTAARAACSSSGAATASSCTCSPQPTAAAS